MALKPETDEQALIEFNEKLRQFAKAWRELEGELSKTWIGRFTIWLVKVLARLLPAPKEGK